MTETGGPFSFSFKMTSICIPCMEDINNMDRWIMHSHDSLFHWQINSWITHSHDSLFYSFMELFKAWQHLRSLWLIHAAGTPELLLFCNCLYTPCTENSPTQSNLNFSAWPHGNKIITLLIVRLRNTRDVDSLPPPRVPSHRKILKLTELPWTCQLNQTSQHAVGLHVGPQSCQYRPCTVSSQ
jgi:hypothetical protein